MKQCKKHIYGRRGGGRNCIKEAKGDIVAIITRPFLGGNEEEKYVDAMFGFTLLLSHD